MISYKPLQYYMHNKTISNLLNSTALYSNVKHIHEFSNEIKMKFETRFSAIILKNKNQSVCTYNDTSLVFVWFHFQINRPSKGNFSPSPQGISYAFYKTEQNKINKTLLHKFRSLYKDFLSSRALFKYRKHRLF